MTVKEKAKKAKVEVEERETRSSRKRKAEEIGELETRVKEKAVKLVKVKIEQIDDS